MLNKSLYRLSILSANFFLLSFIAIVAEDPKDQEIVGIVIDPEKIHQLQEMYFIPKNHPCHKSQFHEQFEPVHVINFQGM